MFGVQSDKCFLYGKKFKITTDHAESKWLITVKNHQCARLTRWVLKHAEYDIEVILRPGKNINADVLSRRVAAAVSKLPDSSEEAAVDVKPMQGASLTKEVVRQPQANDEFCQQVYWTLSGGRHYPILGIRFQYCTIKLEPIRGSEGGCSRFTEGTDCPATS